MRRSSSSSSSAKKIIDKLWSEFYQLKKSNRQFENLAVIDRIIELLNELTQEDIQSKNFDSIRKLIGEVKSIMSQKTTDVQDKLKEVFELINKKSGIIRSYTRENMNISVNAPVKKTTSTLSKSPSVSDLKSLLVVAPQEIKKIHTSQKDKEIIQEIFGTLRQREKQKDVQEAIEEGRRSTKKEKERQEKYKQIRENSVKKYLSQMKDKKIKIELNISRKNPPKK
jgi:hypothetical protein